MIYILSKRHARKVWETFICFKYEDMLKMGGSVEYFGVEGGGRLSLGLYLGFLHVAGVP